MKFTIENGNNICSIGMSNIGSYIRFNYPLTVVWHDCRGSVGKYFCVLPYNEEYRNTVREKIHENLNQDFTNNIQGLCKILKPLFPIFKNGNYILQFYNNKEKEFFEYKSSIDNFEKSRYEDLEVVFPNEITDITKANDVIKNHKQFLKEVKISKEFYPSNLLEYSTSGIYEGFESLYATQPQQDIDGDRVKYFENIIKNGERPFAIIFNAYFEVNDYYSSNFILDGHHKLLAYKKLGIYPPLATITYSPENVDEVEFDARKLAESLYPWQTKHIMEHWEDKDFLDEGAAQDGLAKSEIIIKASSKSKNSSFLDWLNNIFE
ncbi:hypothetical protein ATE47_09445 [Chryseobacterium sp. IHB B 17019]|nr:hypothetical protein [Chryseobacterium sp. IHB B 17019]ALR30738.1 hypothetical protein ATE47_09445 [Chryseobacterium sp. IHB B 17019]